VTVLKNGRRVCTCERPSEFVTPTKKGICVDCNALIDFEWTSTDATVAAFFDRLATTFPSWPAVPQWFEAFRAQCEDRERAGRDEFGFRYLARDNAGEALEEAADGGIYHHLEILRKLRNGQAEDIDVHLQAAYHFAQAHRFSRMAQAKARGNTGPGMDE
jgi:hypothetical protein